MSQLTIELKEVDELRAERKKYEIWCGIYFLWKDDEIVYIGQSANGNQRRHGHFKPFNGHCRFDHYTFIPCPIDQLGVYEYAYIAKYKPKHNKRAW